MDMTVRLEPIQQAGEGAVRQLGELDPQSVEVQSRNHTVLFPIAETVVIFNEAMPAISADFEIER